MGRCIQLNAALFLGSCFVLLWAFSYPLDVPNEAAPSVTLSSISADENDTSDARTESDFSNHSFGEVSEQVTEPSINLLPEKDFKDAEKAIVDYVNSMLKQMLPHFMTSGQSSLSSHCMSSMMKIFAGLRRLSGWTLKLLDSVAKPEAGLLTGRAYSFGDYDQCLAISVNKRGQEVLDAADEQFRGKYCKIRVQQQPAIIEAARHYHEGKINKSELGKLKEMIESVPFVPVSEDFMSHQLGICMPSLCTEEDIQGIVQSFPFPGVISVESCETKEDVKPSLEQRVVIVVFLFLLSLVGVSTVADAFIQLFPDNTVNRYTRKTCVNIIVSFSIRTNTKKLIQRIQNDSDEIPDWRIIRGLVVVALECLIFYHTYLPPFQEYYRQAGYLKNLESYFKEPLFSCIVGLPLVIETFFFTCGFSITNRIWKSTWKEKMVKVNVFKLALCSYLKLCIPLLLCTGVIVLLPLIGSGPFWNSVYARNIRNCEQSWWSILGMYGNFLDVDEQCFPHFWFVPCLMQIVLLSLVFILTMARWPKFGSLITVLVGAGCNTAVGLATFKSALPPSYVDYFAERKANYQWKIQQSLPLIHFVSYAFGMLLGVFMSRKTDLRINRFFALVGWIVSIGVVVGLCQLLLQFYHQKAYDDIGSATYAGLHVTLFCMVLVWITLACGYGYGGFVGSLLSWSVLDPLYKLCYLAYLFHLVIITFHAGVAREHFHYSHGEMVFRGISYIVLSYVAAYIAYMIVVMPLKSLHSAIYSYQSQTITIRMPSENGFKKNSSLASEHNNSF